MAKRKQTKRTKNTPPPPDVSEPPEPKRTKRTISSESPRKVPRLPTSAKSKYISGGDVDREGRRQDHSSVKPQRVSHRQSSPIPLDSDCEMGSEDQSGVGHTNDEEPSIAERLRARRAAPNPRTMTVPTPTPDVAEQDDDLDANTPKPGPAQKSGGRGGESALSAVPKGSNAEHGRQRGVSGIVDVFTGMKVAEQQAKSYSIQPPLENSTNDRSWLQRDETPVPARPYVIPPSPPHLEQQLPMSIVNTNTTSPAQGPFTPLTAPTHHLYAYDYPKKEEVPGPEEIIIWQVGRAVSILGAPSTQRFAAIGTLRRRPKNFQETGIEPIISYMPVNGDALWRTVPNDLYIAEVYLVIDQLKFEDLWQDYRVITLWCERMRRYYRIDNVPATTDHCCRFRDVPQRNRIEHTFSCKLVSRDAEVQNTLKLLAASAAKAREPTPPPPPSTQPRLFTPSPPPFTQPRPFTQRDPSSPMFEPLSSVTHKPTEDAQQKKRKKDRDVDSSSSESISVQGTPPRQSKPRHKRSRMHSPIDDSTIMDVDAQEPDDIIEVEDDDDDDWKDRRMPRKSGKSVSYKNIHTDGEDHRAPRRLQKSSSHKKHTYEREEGDEDDHHRAPKKSRKTASHKKKTYEEDADEEDEDEGEARRAPDKSRKSASHKNSYEDKDDGGVRRVSKKPGKFASQKNTYKGDEDEDVRVVRQPPKKTGKSIGQRRSVYEGDDDDDDRGASRKLRKSSNRKKNTYEDEEGDDEDYRRAPMQSGRSSNHKKSAYEDKEGDEASRAKLKANTTNKALNASGKGSEDKSHRDQDNRQPTPVDKGKGKGKAREEPIASGSRSDNVWTAELQDKLQEAGALLHELMECTGLPLHTLLRKLDLILKYTRDNSFSLYKSYLKATAQGKTVASFEEYSTIASEPYNEIKFNCLAEGGDEAWALQQQQWKDAIFKASGADGPVPPDKENAEVMMYMHRVLDQQEDLVTTVRHNGPVHILSLVYSTETAARPLSRFVTADENVKTILDNIPGDTHDFIERVITLSKSLEMGVTDPNDMMFERFQEIAVGRSEMQGTHKPAQGAVKSKLHGSKVKKEVGTEDGISDYRGMVETYRQTKVTPEVLKGLDREDRAVCRMILRGFFADAQGTKKAPAAVWARNFANALMNGKLTFFFAGDFEPAPASAGWNPNNWSKAHTKAFLELIQESPDLAHMEKWSHETKMIQQGDSRYNSIPLIISSTAPHNVLLTIGDMLATQLREAGSAGAEIIGETDMPLERVRHRSELKKDITALHKGTGAIKNRERLERFYEVTGRGK